MDYHLVRRAAKARFDRAVDRNDLVTTGLHEVDSVKDFGAEMERRGVLEWWRTAMEFETPGDRL